MNETIIDRRQNGHAPMSGNKSSVKQALETGHVNSHRGFLAHLFGLDGPQRVGIFPQHPYEPNKHVAKSVSKMSALQTLKHLNPFEGLKLTLNKLLLILIIFLVSWLFVIYYIRHHDLFSRASLDKESPHSSASYTDLGIINASRTAIPVRTSSSLGDIYVPQPDSTVASPAKSSANSAMNGAASALDTNDDPDPVTVQNEISEQKGLTPNNANAPLGVYSLPVSTPNGFKMKTVVNR